MLRLLSSLVLRETSMLLLERSEVCNWLMALLIETLDSIFLITFYCFHFSDLRLHRNKLLELLTDPNHDKVTLEKTSNDYFSLLIGLVKPFEEGETENKLRNAVKFRWTNTLLGGTPV